MSSGLVGLGSKSGLIGPHSGLKQYRVGTDLTASVNSGSFIADYDNFVMPYLVENVGTKKWRALCSFTMYHPYNASQASITITGIEWEATGAPFGGFCVIGGSSEHMGFFYLNYSEDWNKVECYANGSRDQYSVTFDAALNGKPTFM